MFEFEKFKNIKYSFIISGNLSREIIYLNHIHIFISYINILNLIEHIKQLIFFLLYSLYYNLSLMRKNNSNQKELNCLEIYIRILDYSQSEIEKNIKIHNFIVK